MQGYIHMYVYQKAFIYSFKVIMIVVTRTSFLHCRSFHFNKIKYHLSCINHFYLLHLGLYKLGLNYNVNLILFLRM